ncbi:hypothetical protein KSX_73230 [Ktedonospora formicarum]|uniref:Uncharacterized protein n=1 Tax=Ktedonospora formicarum TaxID=2778364 RepID=A0A8J3MY05_9CHLR|nr:hypothetical protein KSX_73230 [Ktedonospora formicarum]
MEEAELLCPLRGNQTVDVAALFDLLSQNTEFGTTGMNESLKVGFKCGRWLIWANGELKDEASRRFLFRENS